MKSALVTSLRIKLNRLKIRGGLQMKKGGKIMLQDMKCKYPGYLLKIIIAIMSLYIMIKSLRLMISTWKQGEKLASI